MTWPWRTLAPGAMPLAKRGLVGIGGHVAVGVLDLDAPAVARSHSALMTVPLPAETIGVPIRFAQSTPVCIFE